MSLKIQWILVMRLAGNHWKTLSCLCGDYKSQTCWYLTVTKVSKQPDGLRGNTYTPCVYICISLPHLAKPFGGQCILPVYFGMQPDGLREYYNSLCMYMYLPPPLGLAFWQPVYTSCILWDAVWAFPFNRYSLFYLSKYIYIYRVYCI